MFLSYSKILENEHDVEINIIQIFFDIMNLFSFFDRFFNLFVLTIFEYVCLDILSHKILKSRFAIFWKKAWVGGHASFNLNLRPNELKF